MSTFDGDELLTLTELRAKERLKVRALKAEVRLRERRVQLHEHHDAMVKQANEITAYPASIRPVGKGGKKPAKSNEAPKPRGKQKNAGNEEGSDAS